MPSAFAFALALALAFVCFVLVLFVWVLRRRFLPQLLLPVVCHYCVGFVVVVAKGSALLFLHVCTHARGCGGGAAAAGAGAGACLSCDPYPIRSGFSAKSKRKILRKSASARFLRGTSNTALPRAGGQGGRTTRPLASPVVTHASGAAPPAFLTDSPGIPSPIGTPIRVGTGFRTTATTSSGSRTASPSSLPGDDDDDDAVSQVSAFEPDVDLRPQTTPAMVRSVARPMTTAVKARQPSAHSHLRVKPLQVKSTSTHAAALLRRCAWLSLLFRCLGKSAGGAFVNIVSRTGCMMLT